MMFHNPLNTKHQINVPTGQFNLPRGVQAQINFYDPYTGKRGPSVSTLSPVLNREVNYRMVELGINIRGPLPIVNNIVDLIRDNKNIFPQLQNINPQNIQVHQMAMMDYIPPILQGNVDIPPDVPVNFYNPIVGNVNPISLAHPHQAGCVTHHIDELNIDIIGSRDITIQVRNLIEKNISLLKREKMASFQQPSPSVRVRSETWDLYNGMLVGPSGITSYSGSGILLCNLYKSDPTVFLVKNKQTQMYEDFGGSIHVMQLFPGNNTLELNAKNELIEESCNLFEMDIAFNNSNRYIDIPYEMKSVYRCYLVCVSGIDESDDILNTYFRNNKMVALKYKASKEYDETDKISRFYIKDIFNVVRQYSSIQSSQDKIAVKNIDRQDCILSNRVFKVFDSLYKNKQLGLNVFMNKYQAGYEKQIVEIGNRKYDFHTYFV